MKRFVAMVFILLANFIYAAKDLSTLKTLKFEAEEKQVINGKEKTLKYLVQIEFPDKIRKEIIFPDLNKGELYIYQGNKKLLYLPIFDEYKESEIDGDENRIIQAINRLIDLEKNSPAFKKDYHQKKLKDFYIDDSGTVSVYIKEYLEKEDYILPKNIEIREGDINLGIVILKNVEINPKLNTEEFKLEKDKKWYFYEVRE